MATWNKVLQGLSVEEVHALSKRYLMGWRDLAKLGIRIKGLNSRRKKLGLSILTEKDSFIYRMNYVKNNFDNSFIIKELKSYMLCHKMADQRWVGIELFDCRFGREFSAFFTELLGKTTYTALSEEARVTKLVDTQISLYGGVGLNGRATKEKAIQTNLKKYGCENPMQNKDIQKILAETNIQKYGGKSPFCSPTVKEKANKYRNLSLLANIKSFKKDMNFETDLITASFGEFFAYYKLVMKFGEDAVVYEYGNKPYDERYPFNCDFYIKSKDLFIEMNLDVSHGGHWFNETAVEDIKKIEKWKKSNNARFNMAVKVWSEKDVLKRRTAKDNALNYLVFWDNKYCSRNGKTIPRLSDFNEWLDDYDGDYLSYIKDHKENTY